MQILLISQILVCNHIGVVGWVAFGKFLVSESIRDDESKSDEKDDENLQLS